MDCGYWVDSVPFLLTLENGLNLNFVSDVAVNIAFEEFTGQRQNKKHIQLPYLSTGVCHVSNFFLNNLLKTASLCDLRLQNYGAVNVMPFFSETPYIARLETRNMLPSIHFSRLSFVDADSGERCIIEFNRERSRTQRCRDVTDDVVMTSLMICCGFIVCWSPIGVYIFMMVIDHIRGGSGLFYDFVTMMVLMNSCINPFIYAAKYREFQTGVRRLLRKQVEPSVQPVEIQMGRVCVRQNKEATENSAKTAL